MVAQVAGGFVSDSKSASTSSRSIPGLVVVVIVVVVIVVVDSVMVVVDAVTVLKDREVVVAVAVDVV